MPVACFDNALKIVQEFYSAPTSTHFVNGHTRSVWHEAKHREDDQASKYTGATVEKGHNKGISGEKKMLIIIKMRG